MASKSYSISFNVLGNLDPSLLAALQKAQQQIQGLGKLNNRAIAQAQKLQRAQDMLNQLKGYRDLQRALQNTQAARAGELLNVNRLNAQRQATQNQLESYRESYRKLQRVQRQDRAQIEIDKASVARLKSVLAENGKTMGKNAANIMRGQIRSAESDIKAREKTLSQMMTGAARELKAQESSVRGLENSFAAASAKAKELQATLAAQRQQLSQLRSALPSGTLAAQEMQLRTQIQQTTNALNAEIAALERRNQLRQNFSQSQQNLSNAYSNFQNALDNAGSIMSPFKDAAQNAITFERSLSRLKSLTQMENIRNGNAAQVETEMASMQRRIETLGMTTEYTRNEIAEAANYFAMSGWNEKQINAALPAAVDLASITRMPIDRIADMFSDDMTIMGLRAGEQMQLSNGQWVDAAQHTADAISYAVTKANMNYEDLHTALTYNAGSMRLAGLSQGDILGFNMILANAGIKGSKSGTALGTGFIRLMAPAKKGAAALEELGFTASEAQKEMARTQETLATMGLNEKSTAFEKVMAMKKSWDENKAAGNDDANTAMLDALIGKNAFKGWAELLDSDKLEQALAIAQKIDSQYVEGWSQETAAVMRDNTYTQIEYMKSALDALQGSVGQALLPSINAAAQAITPLITSMTEWISQNQEAVQWAAMLAAALSTVIVVGAGLALVSAAISFISSGLAMLTPLVTLLGAAFAFVTSPIFLVVAAIAAVIAIIATLINHADQIKQAFTDAWNHPKGAITGFCELMKSAINGAVQFVLDRWNTMKSALSHPIEAISNFLGTGSVVGGNVKGYQNGMELSQVFTGGGGVGALQAQALETQAVQVNASQLQLPEMQAAQALETQTAQVNAVQLQLPEMQAAQSLETQAVQVNAAQLQLPEMQAAQSLETQTAQVNATQLQMPEMQAAQDVAQPVIEVVQPVADSLNVLPPSAEMTASGLENVSNSSMTTSPAVDTMGAASQGATGNITALAGVAVNAASGVAALSGAASAVAGALSAKAAEIAGIVISVPQINMVPVNVPVPAAVPAGHNATGGIYPKGEFLTWFAEDSPEAAIPLTKSARAFNLWSTVGNMLGFFPDNKKDAATFPSLNLSTPNLSTNNLATNEPINITITVNIAGNANEESVRNGIQQALPSVRDFASELAAYRHEQARRSFA